MQLGMIGLGRMGAKMVLRLLKAGHECVVYDRNQIALSDLVKQGAIDSTDADGGALGFRECRAMVEPKFRAASF